MLSSDQLERRWRWRLFLCVWACLFILAMLGTAWQVGFQQSSQVWLWYAGAAAGVTSAISFPVAQFYPYDKIWAKELSARITQKAKRRFDPSKKAMTPRLGYFNRPELTELGNSLKVGEVIVVIGKAGNGKTGLLSKLIEELTQSALILAIDARTLPLSVSTPEEVGSSACDVHENPAILLARVAKITKRPSYLIVDEIDGLLGTDLWRTLTEIIHDALASGIVTILAIRVEGKRQIHILEDLRKQSLQVNSIALNPFSVEIARSRLAELGITDPSESLINLSTNLRDFGIIARLVDNNAIIPRGKISRVQLWDAYVDEMDQKEANGQGHIKQRAIDLAREMLRSGKVQVSIETDSDTAKLLNWGACVADPDVERIEFQYEEMMFFLYARDAVSRAKSLQEIRSEVDSRYLSRVLESVQERGFEKDIDYVLKLVGDIQS